MVSTRRRAFDIPEDKTRILKSVLGDQKSLVNKYIDHYWYLDGDIVLYNGKVMKLKTPQSGFYFKVSYWEQDEDESDGEDSRMDVHKFLADYILGTLFLFSVLSYGS